MAGDRCSQTRRLAWRKRCRRVLPQGGNTSLCGGATPSGQGKPPVIVALTRMRRIRSLDPVNNTMVVDAGCVLATIQETAAVAGRLFPVSLGAEGSCQIGGNIATNAGGTHVLRYGMMRALVLGLEAVLPNGTVPNGIEAQAEACWRNIIAILADAGMGADDLVKITTYLVRPEDVAPAGAARAKHFGDARPGSATIIVKALVAPE